MESSGVEAIGLFFALALIWCFVEWLRVKFKKWWKNED